MNVKAAPLREIEMPTAVLGLDASPDGGTLYAACLDGGVYAVDTESGDRAMVGKHDSYASGVILLGDGSLVSGGYDGALGWHDVAARRTRHRVAAHDFWSWQIAASADGRFVASATGQYLCGGYKYEPAPEREPSVKVFDASNGALLHALTHVPPVESVAFSPDGRHVAAGNLMGEVRVWETAGGKEVARWTTPSFTGWGIIKGHYYTGGIFSMVFTPDGEELIVAGMGSTRDPAAGNGRQLWQRFAWRETPARKVDETHSGESGSGLMETVAFHPSGGYFVMGGRIAKGNWNVAFFDGRSGSIVGSLDTKMRVTRAVFRRDGRRLFLAGAVAQKGRSEDRKFRDFGRIGVYRLPGATRAF